MREMKTNDVRDSGRQSPGHWLHSTPLRLEDPNNKYRLQGERDGEREGERLHPHNSSIDKASQVGAGEVRWEC